MNLFALIAVGVDVQAQSLAVQVELVLATTLVQDLSNVTGIFDLPELDVTLALLDGVTNKLGGAGLTLCADNEGLLLLAGLVDHECSTLSILLCDLLGFNCGCELGREGQVLCGDTVLEAVWARVGKRVRTVKETSSRAMLKRAARRARLSRTRRATFSRCVINWLALN